MPTIDFSGWPDFCLESTPDSLVRAVCAGLEVRQDRISPVGKGPLPLHLMCKESENGPLTIPLHPAAEPSCRERGHLS